MLIQIDTSRPHQTPHKLRCHRVHCYLKRIEHKLKNAAIRCNPLCWFELSSSSLDGMLVWHLPFVCVCFTVSPLGSRPPFFFPPAMFEAPSMHHSQHFHHSTQHLLFVFSFSLLRLPVVHIKIKETSPNWTSHSSHTHVMLLSLFFQETFLCRSIKLFKDLAGHCSSSCSSSPSSSSASSWKLLYIIAPKRNCHKWCKHRQCLRSWRWCKRSLATQRDFHNFGRKRFHDSE